MAFFKRQSLLPACVLALVLADCSAREAPPPPEKMAMKRVTVEGTDIRYVEQGEGKPIVLVHGIPTSSYLWRDMIGELAVHGRVIALDLPGFGFSDPPPEGDYSIATYARLLEGFLEALSLEGGTHNPWAPPFEAVAESFLPVLARTGVKAEVRLERHGRD